jgi:hypothetical protein
MRKRLSTYSVRSTDGSDALSVAVVHAEYASVAAVQGRSRTAGLPQVRADVRSCCRTAAVAAAGGALAARRATATPRCRPGSVARQPQTVVVVRRVTVRN